MVSVQKTTRRLLFMIYVGRFDENDIKHGIDKQKVKKAMQKKHNLKYTNAKLVKQAGKVIAIDIWVCDSYEFYI